jgi:hypothetical protein
VWCVIAVLLFKLHLFTLFGVLLFAVGRQFEGSSYLQIKNCISFEELLDFQSGILHHFPFCFVD